MNRLIKKIFHTLFLCIVWGATIYARWAVKPRKSNVRKKILALPYYPEYYAGGHERIGDWKDAVEQQGVQFDVHWASNESFYKESLVSGNVWSAYVFYFKVLFRRLSLLKTLHEYDAVWVQRAFIPFYPFKHAFLENAISKHGNLTYDFYDADYLSNNNLVVETIRCAQRVSVPSRFLMDFCSKINPNTHIIPFAFNYTKYPVKVYPEKSMDEIIIGWAGSPSNFDNVKSIGPQLVEIEKKFPSVRFLFVCRERIDIGLKYVQYQKWGDPGFEYFEVISRFDIGINPMLKEDERTKAKTSFKCMEYMSLGIALLTSPNGIPNSVIDDEHGLIVHNAKDWYSSLEKLLLNHEMIKQLGKNARACIEQEHDYTKKSTTLIEVLLN